MLASISSRQLSEWVAYAAVEPFGEERADYRLAYALAVIVNLFRGKDDPPVKVADLLPRVGVLAHEESGAEGAPPVHPNVRRFEEMMQQWAQSPTS
jgi:hypothetical protein